MLKCVPCGFINELDSFINELKAVLEVLFDLGVALTFTTIDSNSISL